MYIKYAAAAAGRLEVLPYGPTWPPHPDVDITFSLHYSVIMMCNHRVDLSGLSKWKFPTSMGSGDWIREQIGVCPP